MEIGVIGKPNVGKSTLFNAFTLLDVPMAPYPFTTLEPHRGVGAVRFPCPHPEKGTPCTPGNAKCVDGIRWVPVNLVDVPGLVPGASEGKGLGRQFLDDLRASDGFIQVVDAAGATTAEGVSAEPGSVDPAVEVQWLEEELVEWVAGILGRDFERHARGVESAGTKIEDFLAQRLAGLAISPPAISAGLRGSTVNRSRPSLWTEADRRTLARSLLRAAKPRLVAANKADRSTPEAVEALRQAIDPIPLGPTCAEAELTLRRATRGGLVRYRPGDPTFQEVDAARLSPGQARALGEVRSILRRWGGTGVQPTLERMVYERLAQMVVFPVEDELRWTDGKDRVLPDALLVPQELPARALAYRVHTDLGENFIRAIDGRTHRALGADHPLEPGSVVRIVSRR